MGAVLLADPAAYVAAMAVAMGLKIAGLGQAALGAGHSGTGQTSTSGVSNTVWATAGCGMTAMTAAARATNNM
jgi:hypothetical protein